MVRRPRLPHVLLASLALWVLIASLSYASSSHARAGISTSIDKTGTGGAPYQGFAVVDLYDAGSVYEIVNSSRGPLVLYFEQEDCPGCKEIWPAIERLIEERPALTLVRIHIDKIFSADMGGALKLAEKFKVPGTPTLIVTRDGVEVARQVGVFRGDQYEGLKAFVESALSSPRGSGGPASPAAWYLQPLGLGLLAALSPCSLPMMAIFASSARLRTSELLKALAALLALLVPAASALGILSSMGRVGGLSPYYAITTYVGTLVASWGFLTFVGREPVTSIRLRKVPMALPILGLQCSFPFALATLSLYSRDPVGALASAAMFSLGYSLPYVALPSALSAISRGVGGKGGGKILRLAQAIVLTASGAYLIATGALNIFL